MTAIAPGPSSKIAREGNGKGSDSSSVRSACCALCPDEPELPDRAERMFIAALRSKSSA